VIFLGAKITLLPGYYVETLLKSTIIINVGYLIQRLLVFGYEAAVTKKGHPNLIVIGKAYPYTYISLFEEV